MSEHAKEFQAIIDKARSLDHPMRVAVAGADAENILTGLFEAESEGWVKPVLVGNYEKIRAVLEKIGCQDRKYDIQPVADGTSPVRFAIEMINAGKADVLMRGNTQTRDFLMPVLNKANHLLVKDALVTDIVMLKIPGYDRILAISDVTLLIDPSADARVEVARNMVQVLKSFGIEKPNIALLAMVETPSFHMRDTVEDQTIVRKHQKEPIADCNLVGPISYDLIISKEAARLKNFDCPYCGEFDGVVVPNLMSGNLLVKVLEHNAGAMGGGVLAGARIPIAITSRSDLPEKAYLSVAACAAMLKDKVYDKFA
ncbi:MAG: phosphate acyltransferase [Eubacteriales bacterium]|nr:phosphate acyltransferase [Eubacteriales bacterium]